MTLRICQSSLLAQETLQKPNMDSALAGGHPSSGRHCGPLLPLPRVLHSLGCPQTCSGAEDDLELLIHLPPPPRCWDVRSLVYAVLEIKLEPHADNTKP